MVSLELLCPAKDYETGIAAIDHGADAIYIGASKFGAREDAGNSIQDIERLVKYAHQFYAKVYVTVNTIIYEDELLQVKDIINELYRIGVDAIIIQDMAILEMDLPPINLFASTQTHNNTSEKVEFLGKNGIKRVILARELSLEEVKEIRNKTSIELEFFIHGALCVCYSGQCYFSQAITERSANRGACAQPCRSSYDLIDSKGNILVKNKHLLSLKDFNLSNYIDELIQAGITSFKIEGRLKDINYVKNITSYYNQILNNIIQSNSNLKRSSSGYCDIKFEPDPERSFNRGFTTHFINERQKEQSSMNTQKSIGKKLGEVQKIGDGWFSISGKYQISNGDGLCFFDSKGILRGLKVNRYESGKIFPFGELNDLKTGDIIYRNFDQGFTKELNRSVNCRYIDIKIALKQTESKLVFHLVDSDKISTIIEIDNDFEPAKDSNKAIETLKNQFIKTGDTIFKVKKVNINMITPVFIPISKINKIRRDLIEKHIANRLVNYNNCQKRITNNLGIYPNDILSYKGNVSNSLARQFYKKHGVTKVDAAFELEPKKDIELMVTRYCIKFEMGICPSKQNGKDTGKLYLKDNQNTYPLEFDCRNCIMIVMSPIKKL